MGKTFERSTSMIILTEQNMKEYGVKSKKVKKVKKEEKK